MKKYILLAAPMLAIGCLTHPVCAEPVINEFMASNDSIYPDNRDFDDYSDWLEIYNPASTNVSLTDYYLTDNLSLPLKWKIPDGTTIPAHGYLMVRADGFNAGPGEVHGRDYYPFDSTFITERYHASFKLSAGGESVGIYRLTTPPVQNTLISAGASWKYLDSGGDPGADWMGLTFDDSSWLTGNAEFGYGDGDESTVVSYGPDANNKYASTQFRIHFNVLDPSIIADVRLRMVIDDGAVVYLNGAEVARVRVADGITYSDYAGGGYGPEPSAFEQVEMTSFPFRAGDNVLAVTVHQYDGVSSDLSMDAELIVTEINPGDVVLVDAITNYPAQLSDISYGRDPSSTNGWSYFAEPTPEGPNSTGVLTEFVPAGAVTASLESGFYEGAQSVALDSPGPGETIHYTLDGSVPGSSSPVYSNELAIAGTTILRARAFADGRIPGTITTRSYFIDENTTLPVFSMIADPDTLFDDTIGIAENNTDYPFKGREVPVRFEMFEADKSPAFAVNAGARIAGENIWGKAQKPFNIYMRSKYGDDLINYQMFPGQPVGTFGEITLRNGGDDWEETLLRDAMMPAMLEGRMDAALYTYRPSIMFLNGQFWGIYNIRKRFDATYFANEHQLAEGDYDQLAYVNDFVNDIYAPLTVESGSTEAYESLLAFCTTNNPADPAVYSQIQEMMNIDSFIDWAISTDFAINTSWRHNREFWRPRTDDGKWEWIINDFDRGFDMDYLNSSSSKSLIDDFQLYDELFMRLDNNSDFVTRLAQRYAAHIGSTFQVQRISDRLDDLTAEQDGEVARHKARWPESMVTRDAQIAEIKNYFSVRPAIALQRIEVYLGISDAMASLTLAASPIDSGIISVAGVKMLPEYNSTVSLYENRPVELSAEPAPGYSFVQWSNGDTNSTIFITLSGAQTLTAIFAGDAESIIDSTIGSDTTLSSAGSPYTVTNDLVIEAGRTLTIDPGVQLLMPAGTSIIVNGSLIVNGTEEAPVEIKSRTGAPWGNIGFVNATGESTLTHLLIRGATLSRQDPLNLKAAISGFNSAITLDHVDIDAVQPVFARYGSTTLRNCRIHIQFTGDGINVKSGDGLVENSVFTGNSSPDTDAIDFDNVVGGAIRGNRIYAFLGFNSDAIDVGEGCQDLMVVSNRIFNITDKGVSVGQASVAYIERNLIVDCDMGVGIKDAGSTAYIDQNTFARNNYGVASYEKNEGAGGGSAYISNCIFSRTRKDPVSVDSLSILTVDYSLSDTLALVGTGNLLDDPLFVDEGSYNFSLSPESPAIDTGDPGHELDGDETRADMGAYYTYDPDDYPYYIPNLVVINEVLAHSHDIAPDWIELQNSSGQPVDLGGWYLSDDPGQPMKYRIADGTILPPYGFAVFYEDLNFGAESSDPGSLVPFALSENGDTVNLLGPGNALRPDYKEKETFGASLRGVTRGRYYKASSRTFNFVSMTDATPGAPNSAPKVGPVVISEIMYHPPNGEAEYIELTNIDSSEVTLYDADMNAGWKMTKGLDHAFSVTTPVVMAPGEKILLVRNPAAFDLEYGAPAGTQVIQWDGGGLDNGGETLEISMPGDTNEVGELQFIRVDRVDFKDSDPWPVGPDGGGSSLARINERAYGNDFINWQESVTTPGQTGFELWAGSQDLPPGLDGPEDDPDGDGIVTAWEYAGGTDPMVPSAPSGSYALFDNGSTVSFLVPTVRSDVSYAVLRSDSLIDPVWVEVPAYVAASGGETVVQASDPDAPDVGFYRLVILLYNRY